MLSRITLIGNVGRDPEIRYSQNGNRYAICSIAVNDYRRSSMPEETQWYTLYFFDSYLLSVVERFVRKGSFVYIEGKPSFRAYINRDGQAACSAEVRVSIMNFLNRARENIDYQDAGFNQSRDNRIPASAFHDSGVDFARARRTSDDSDDRYYPSNQSAYVPSSVENGSGSKATAYRENTESSINDVSDDDIPF